MLQKIQDAYEFLTPADQLVIDAMIVTLHTKDIKLNKERTNNA